MNGLKMYSQRQKEEEGNIAQGKTEGRRDVLMRKWEKFELRKKSGFGEKSGFREKFGFPAE